MLHLSVDTKHKCMIVDKCFPLILLNIFNEPNTSFHLVFYLATKLTFTMTSLMSFLKLSVIVFYHRILCKLAIKFGFGRMRIWYWTGTLKLHHPSKIVKIQAGQWNCFESNPQSFKGKWQISILQAFYIFLTSRFCH